MNREIKMRLLWVRHYHETGNAGFVCRRCGISRPTLRKWVRRYEKFGLKGLQSKSRRPIHSPTQKLNEQIENWILELRKKRKLGTRRIQNELRRNHDCSLSLATIHKVLKKHNVKPLKRIRHKSNFKRYQRPIPGDRVQIDTCKIASGLYQYTAVDDCTRYRVLGLYSRRTASNTLLFLEKLIEEMPFSIQRIQSDRGTEFFAIKVQKFLMKYSIKFRPIKPGSPHLNGKVERSQKTDLDEFYSIVNLKADDLKDRLQEWQHFYNWQRYHGSLKGLTPMEKYFQVNDKAPYWDEVEKNYEPTEERIQEQNYQTEMKVRKLLKKIGNK
jgi:transposase InsO family protein